MNARAAAFMVTANGDLVICVIKKKGHPLHPFTVAAQKCL